MYSSFYAQRYASRPDQIITLASPFHCEDASVLGLGVFSVQLEVTASIFMELTTCMRGVNRKSRRI